AQQVGLTGCASQSHDGHPAGLITCSRRPTRTDPSRPKTPAT
ncbi:PPW family C-terminal domain-containing PPE protein, partial [Amycolatopsis balhimycina]